MNSIIKIITDIIPLMVFLYCYKFYDIYIATYSLITMSFVALVVNYVYYRKISYNLLFTFFIVLVLGTITLYTKNTSFIKMKPTIIYSIIAIIIIIGVRNNKIFIKSLMGSILEMDDRVWKSFSYRVSFYLFFMAFANEIIARNFSEDIWVKFKVFGLPVLLMLFFIFNISFFLKHLKD